MLVGALLLGTQPVPRVRAQGPTITIGVAAATSGPVDWIGWRQLNAVQLAVDQANAAGGIEVGGTFYTLAVAHADDGCNGAQAHVAAQALLDAGALAVIGHTCSGASIPAQPIYDGAGVPMVTASSTSPLLTDMGYGYTFRVVYRDDAAAELLATYLRRWLGMQRVAVVQLAIPGVEVPTESFCTRFARLGGTITGIHVVDPASDPAPLLAALVSEDPEAVYFADSQANRAGTMSSLLHGASISVMAWDSMEADVALYSAGAGPAAEGDYAGIWGRSTADMPGYEGFNALYQAAGFAHFGDEAESWGALAYDAANIVIAAIDRADSLDSGAISDAIAATADYQGVVGHYEGFDQKGDVIPQWVSVKHYYDGAWHSVSPSRVYLPLALTDSS